MDPPTKLTIMGTAVSAMDHMIRSNLTESVGDLVIIEIATHGSSDVMNATHHQRTCRRATLFA